MRLKVKTNKSTKVLTVDDGLTFEQFKQKLYNDHDLFNADESIACMKKNFPPKQLEFSDQDFIKSVIANGDQLILETKGEGSNQSHPLSSSASTNKVADNDKDDIPSVYISDVGYIILRNIPDDNSCMFNCLVYALGQYTVQDLRQIVATKILSDPILYNKAILGRDNEDYSAWIMKKDSWGGAIELGILSEYLQLRINCIDIELGQFIKFENEQDPPLKFINLIYSGIHYDILALNSKKTIRESDKANDQTIWTVGSIMDDQITTASHELCKLLQSKNYATNTTTFRVRCLICYEILVGETGAAKHAESTGHFKFGEVDK